MSFFLLNGKQKHENKIKVTMTTDRGEYSEY